MNSRDDALVNAELDLLGAALQDPAITTKIDLVAEQFATPMHGAVWSAITRIHSSTDGLRPDPTTIIEQAKPYRVDHQIFPQLVDRGMTVNADAYARIIVADHRRRTVSEALNKARQRIRTGADPDAELAAVVDQCGNGQDQEPERDRKVRREVERLEIRAEALALFKRRSEPDQPPFDLGTVAEILQRDPDPQARVDGLIPWDSGTTIIAQHKTGKTTLVLNLARSLLTGEPFLDRLETVKLEGNIAFLNFEMTPQMLAGWAHDAGICGDLADRLIQVNLKSRRNPFAHPDDLAKLTDRLRKRNVETLIADPFGVAFTGANQNDAGEVRAFLSDLDRFARADVGAKDVIVTAHAGWNGERTRGSSAINDWADAIITMVKEEDGDRRYIRAVTRAGDMAEAELDYKDRRLTLTDNGSRKDRLAEQKEERRRERRQEREREQEQRVLDSLGPEPISTKSLFDVLRENGPTVQWADLTTALKRLGNKGLAVETDGDHRAQLWTRRYA